MPNTMARISMERRVPDFMRGRLEFFQGQAEVVYRKNGYTTIPMNFPPKFVPTSNGSNFGSWFERPDPQTGLFWHWEEPGPAIRSAAAALGHAFAAITVGGTAKRSIPSRYGPGRPRPDVLMAMNRDAQRGIPPSRRAKPYRRTKRATAKRTPLKMGVLVDESYSMQSLARIAAAVSWSLAHATHYSGGLVAAASFGFDAHPILGPGEVANGYPVKAMMGGQHVIAHGYELLDSVLGLADDDGARVIVVFTDNEFHDTDFADYMVEFEESGGAVVCIRPRQSAMYGGEQQEYALETRFVTLSESDEVKKAGDDFEKQVCAILSEITPVIVDTVNATRDRQPLEI